MHPYNLSSSRSVGAALRRAVVAVTLFSSSTALADVSSWLFVGGGPARPGIGQKKWVSALQFDVGMGTDPANDFVVGGVARLQPLLGEGSDLGLLLRGATHGYANGEWGVALDAGLLQRWWGESATAAMGSVNLGGPWGIGIAVSGVAAEREPLGFSAVLGVDLARLTVYRRSGSSWWPNSFPAYRPEAAGAD